MDILNKQTKVVKLKNTHTKRIEDYQIPSKEKRAEVYFKAAYERIFLQRIIGGCEALSMATNNNLYQVFTNCSNVRRKYKKVYSELYPEFMLFENKYTSRGFWFSEGDAGREERIFAFLLCAEMAMKSTRVRRNG